MKAVGCGISIILAIALVVLFTINYIMEFQVAADTDRLLDRAVISAKIPNMVENLDDLLHNMESRGMTQGHAAIILKTPINDTGLDYKAIKDIRDRAKGLSNEPETSVAYSTGLKDMRDTLGTIQIDGYYWYRIRNPLWWVLLGVFLFTAITGSITLVAFSESRY